MAARKGNAETHGNGLEHALTVLGEHLFVGLMLAEPSGRVLFKSNRADRLLSKGSPGGLEAFIETVARGGEGELAEGAEGEPRVHVRGMRLSGTPERVLLMVRADETIEAAPPEALQANTWGGAARRRLDARFIGRRDELALLATKLAFAQTGPSIVWITGHAGVGKSTLARRFQGTAETTSHRVVWLSGDEVTPSSTAFEAAVASTLGKGAPPLGTSTTADVLVVDAFESLEGITSWLFRRFLPTLGPRLLVLLTTRERPPPALRAELSASAELDELRLANFDRAESSQQLCLYRVPERDHDAIYAFTHGHPLALALVGERYLADDTHHFTAIDPGDVVDTLARRYLQEPRATQDRDALYVLALARVTDEELLASIVGRDRAPAIYEWLARLSFVEATAYGLAPHPLVRDVLRRDFVARTPERADEIGRMLVSRYVARLASAESFQRVRQWLLDALFVRRNEPVLRAMHLERVASTHVRLAEEQEIASLATHVARFEGESSAASFRHFASRQLDNLYVVVEQEPTPVAIVFPLLLSRCDAEDLAIDPELARLEQLAPDARGEGSEVVVFRWFFTTKSHQVPDEHTASLMMVTPFLTAPHADRLDYVVCTMTGGKTWEAVAAPMGFRRRRDLEAPDGAARAVFVQDYRDFVGGERHPLRALESSLVRILHGFGGFGSVAATGEGRSPARDEFDELVRDALTELHAPRELARCRFITTAVGRHAAENEGVVALLQDVLAELDAARQYADSVAVLRATFFEPAGKQEAAAASLGIPFGTYRYRLRKAVACFADALWERELRARSANVPALRFAVPQLRQRFDIE